MMTYLCCVAVHFENSKPKWSMDDSNDHHSAVYNAENGSLGTIKVGT